MNKTETFKDIKGYEGYYKVSNLGRIKSFHKYKEGKIMKPSKTTHGYLAVDLRINKIRRFYTVHRLVATVFIANPKRCINHKDGDKTNNNVNNLEWCTHKQNTQHAFRTGLHKGNSGMKNPNRKLDIEDVKAIRYNHSKNIFTLKELAKIFSVKKVTIEKIVYNKIWVNI